MPRHTSLCSLWILLKAFSPFSAMCASDPTLVSSSPQFEHPSEGLKCQIHFFHTVLRPESWSHAALFPAHRLPPPDSLETNSSCPTRTYAQPSMASPAYNPSIPQLPTSYCRMRYAVASVLKPHRLPFPRTLPLSASPPSIYPLRRYRSLIFHVALVLA